MANFPKYHGITLANNSFIENLVVESLASDPIVTVPGKLWYNTTNKTWNASYLNDADAVVIRSFTTVESFQTFVDNLSSTSANKGANLVGYEGKAGDNSKFSITASTLKSSLDSIVTKIDSIANDVDNIGSGNLVAIQNELDGTQTGAGLGTDGSYTANSSANYISAATSLKDADNKLDTQAKSLQDELDGTQTGAGLGTDGSYTANSSANYISAATSLKDADNKLDTQAKSLQDELAGLSLQKVYDSSVPSGNVVTVQLAEDKIIKFADNNDTTYFQLDPDGSNPIKISMTGPVNVTGNMTISGNLTVEGSTTEITSTINNADRAPSMYA